VVSVDDDVDSVVWSMVMTLALELRRGGGAAQVDEHDAAAAAISHLAASARRGVGGDGGRCPVAFALAAGSFRDATRVAGSAPDLVRAMCESNSAQLLPALDRCSTYSAGPRLAGLGQLRGRAGRGRPCARIRYGPLPRSTSSPSHRRGELA